MAQCAWTSFVHNCFLGIFDLENISVFSMAVLLSIMCKSVVCL